MSSRDTNEEQPKKNKFQLLTRCSCLYRVICTIGLLFLRCRITKKKACLKGFEHNLIILKQTVRNEHSLPAITRIFPSGIYCFAASTARVGRNNILCISRDAVLTNQQLPTLDSSRVAKRLPRIVCGKLNGNV